MAFQAWVMLPLYIFDLGLIGQIAVREWLDLFITSTSFEKSHWEIQSLVSYKTKDRKLGDHIFGRKIKCVKIALCILDV